MERKELHTLIDAAIDAVTCEGCTSQFIGYITEHAIHLVGEHTTRDLGDKLHAHEITPAQAYDALSATMLPLYEMAGETLSADALAEIRAAFLSASSRGLN